MNRDTEGCLLWFVIALLVIGSAMDGCTHSVFRARVYELEQRVKTLEAK